MSDHGISILINFINQFEFFILLDCTDVFCNKRRNLQELLQFVIKSTHFVMTDSICNKTVAFCKLTFAAFCDKRAVTFCNNICHIL